MVVIIHNSQHPAALLSQAIVEPLEGPVSPDRKEPSTLDCLLVDVFFVEEGGSDEPRAVAHPDVGCQIHEGLAEDNGVR